MILPAGTPSGTRSLVAGRTRRRAGPLGPLAPELPQAAGSEDSGLVVRLLGGFEVCLLGRSVSRWPSGRGRSVFKYLLAHRVRPVPRDVLMDLFWPDSSPEAARNSLNVALHGLRQALRQASELPLIHFDAGAYRLSAELPAWIDTEAFEARVAAGRRLESTGRPEAATVAYAAALGLYRDDFMADDPYADWAVLAREHLRVLRLDTLDRLSRILFELGNDAASAEACRHLLTADRCWEAAHHRLMLIHARQGRRHLALRQYRACAEALEAELGIAPAESTRALAERIRGRRQQ